MFTKRRHSKILSMINDEVEDIFEDSDDQILEFTNVQKTKSL